MKTILLNKGLESFVKQSNGLKLEIQGYSFYSGTIDTDSVKDYSLSDFSENGTIILNKISYTKGKNNQLKYADSATYNSALADISNYLFEGSYLPNANGGTELAEGIYSCKYDASLFNLTNISKATTESPIYLDALIVYARSYEYVSPDNRKVWTTEGLLPVAIVVFDGTDIDTKPYIIDNQNNYLSLNINVILGITGKDDLSGSEALSGIDDPILGSMQIVNDGLGTTAKMILASDDSIIASANDYSAYPNMLSGDGVLATTKRLFMTYSLSNNYSNDFGSPARLNIMKTPLDGYRSPQLMLSEANNNGEYVSWDGAMEHYHRYASGGMFWLDSCGTTSMGVSLMSEHSYAYNGAITIGGNNQFAYGNRIAIGGSYNELGRNYSEEEGILVNTTGCDIGRGGGTIIGSYYSNMYCNEAVSTRSGDNYQGTSVIVGGERNVINSYDKNATEIILGGMDNELYSTENSLIGGSFNCQLEYSYNTSILGGFGIKAQNTNYSIINGTNHRLDGLEETIIYGDGNNMISSKGMLLGGSYNYVQDSLNGIEVGQYNNTMWSNNTLNVGYKNFIKGRANSIAIGEGIVLGKDNDVPTEHPPIAAFGQYPLIQSGDSNVLVIGNGYNEGNRNNLVTIDNNGTITVTKTNGMRMVLNNFGLYCEYNDFKLALNALGNVNWQSGSKTLTTTWEKIINKANS